MAEAILVNVIKLSLGRQYKWYIEYNTIASFSDLTSGVTLS